jgi:hypothetical protein
LGKYGSVLPPPHQKFTRSLIVPVEKIFEVSSHDRFNGLEDRKEPWRDKLGEGRVKE